MNGIKVSKKLCRIALPLIGGQIIGKITVKMHVGIIVKMLNHHYHHRAMFFRLSGQHFI